MDTKEKRRPARPRPAAGPVKMAARPVQKQRPRRPETEIVYTPPKPFNRQRLLLQLGVVAAVVVAVFLSLWIFFKISDITVSNLGAGVDGVNVVGTGRYSAETVLKASGIRQGDSLLGLNKARVSSRIITKLPYVKSVRIGIKLPGSVNIEIEELDVVYAISEADGTAWLMNSDGKLVEKTDAAAASGHTQILGVTLELPVVGQQAVAREETPEGTLPEGETQPVTISNAQRLQTAIAVIGYLEENDIMGEVVTVDVSDMGNIELRYGDRFDIALGDAMDLAYKIEVAIAAVNQLADHDRGSLDVSFIIRPEVIYTPQGN